MHTQPYPLARLHAAGERDMLDVALRARLRRAIEVATATESGPSVWARARHRLARFAPHHRVRGRPVPA